MVVADEETAAVVVLVDPYFGVEPLEVEAFLVVAEEAVASVDLVVEALAEAEAEEVGRRVMNDEC